MERGGEWVTITQEKSGHNGDPGTRISGHVTTWLDRSWHVLSGHDVSELVVFGRKASRLAQYQCKL